MAIQKPFNLNQWIKDNRALLKPPVGNKNLYKEAGDYIVMIVGGPNARKDYHYNETVCLDMMAIPLSILRILDQTPIITPQLFQRRQSFVLPSDNTNMGHFILKMLLTLS